MNLRCALCLLLLPSMSSQAAEPPIEIVTLRAENGAEARILTHGATLIGWDLPTSPGNVENVTLSLDSAEDYLDGHPLLGSTVGRYANRIDTGGFVIDGIRYDLETVNEKTNVHIHGGKSGFQKQIWAVASSKTDEVILTLTSPHHHEGFPGTLEAKTTYRLEKDGTLQIFYEATTSAPTHVNLTNHVYFNLDGPDSDSILDHQLQLHAEDVLEFDDRKIPTGKLLPVAGTPFDFREPTRIGDQLANLDAGLDHCFALTESQEIRHAATLTNSSGQLSVEIWTTQPGVQVYTANHLKPREGREHWKPHAGICLECQAFPDTPNHPDFPTTLLRPGETYRQRIDFRPAIP